MHPINFNPFPKLETNRLVLRQLLFNDAETVYRLRTDTVVTEFINRPPERRENDGSEFVSRIHTSVSDNQLVYWVISLKENPELIGSICLWNFNEDKTSAEVGYELFSEYHGKGFMTEALNQVLDFGFDTLKFKTIEAFTHRDNNNSTSLLTKNGFIYNEHRVDNDNLNNIIFTKSND